MMAYACMYYLPEKCGLEDYPGFGPGRVYSLDWVSHILIRSLFKHKHHLVGNTV